jgi:hypothetical protein
MRTVKRLLVLTAAAGALCSAMASAALAASSPVLPPAAKPHGWSLERMTGALAVFTASGNTTAYPDTPFQILYVRPGEGQFVRLPDGSARASGSSTFMVQPGTPFFVPMQNVNDSPPFPEPFPENNEEAIPYFFGDDQYGASGWQISVDGVRTPIGSGYLAGPVTTPPLPDGGGTHMITLGVFLHPLSPGTHTVTISGGLFGAALPDTYGFGPLVAEFTYTVIVE